jgi:CheY-like chemotaxis protein
MNAASDDTYRKVLIIDDSPITTTLLRSLVEAVPQCKAFAFADPMDAFSWCKHDAPDLILTDYRMPSIDGLELTQILLKQPHITGTPVVLVTTPAEHKARKHATQVGVTDFLQKPIDPIDCQARVASLLELSALRKAFGIRAPHLLPNTRDAVLTS